MKPCVRSFHLHELAIAIIFFFFSCEIDDPFAQNSFTPKPATQISFNNFYWTDWLNNETLLLWQSSSREIQQYRITDKSITNFCTLEDVPATDYYDRPIWLTEDNILLMTLSKQIADDYGGYIYRNYLHITHTQTEESRTLLKPLAYENYFQEIVLYDYETLGYGNSLMGDFKEEKKF